MTWQPLALSLTHSVSEIGAIVALAGLLAVALLALMLFTQSREIRRLREWAGRAPERAAEQMRRAAAAPATHVAPAANVTAPARMSGAPAAQVAAGEAAAGEAGVAHAGTAVAVRPPGGGNVSGVRPVPRTTPLVSRPVEEQPTPTGETVPAALGAAAAEEAGAQAHASAHAPDASSDGASAPAGQGAIPAPATAAAIGRAEIDVRRIGVDVAQADDVEGAQAGDAEEERPVKAEGAQAGDADAAQAGDAEPAAASAEEEAAREPALSGAAVAANAIEAPAVVERPRLPPAPAAAPVAYRAMPPADGTDREPRPPLVASTAPATPGAGLRRELDRGAAPPGPTRRAARARSAGTANGGRDNDLPDPREFRFLRDEPRPPSRRWAPIAIGAAAVAVIVVVAALALGGPGRHASASHASGAAGAHARTPTSGAGGGAHKAAVVEPASLQVAVLNSTQINGLAHRLATRLSEQGYRRAQAMSGQPAGSYTTSMVEYAPGYNAQAEAVARALAIEAGGVRPLEAATHALAPGAAVVVIATAAQAAGGATGDGATPGAGEAATGSEAGAGNAESGTGAGGQ